MSLAFRLNTTEIYHPCADLIRSWLNSVYTLKRSSSAFYSLLSCKLEGGNGGAASSSVSSRISRKR